MITKKPFTMIETQLDVDASGLMCPLPLLRLKKALMEISSGHIIKITTTDPAAHLDFGVYCHQAGHQIIDFIKQPHGVIFYVQKK